MQQQDFNNGLIEFIRQSPTPFHAVRQMASMLDAAGFTRLYERDAWQLPEGSCRYYVIRNDSSIIACSLNHSLQERGVRMVGAHTDSPCLKVKPNPNVNDKGYLQLGVEVYGGALLNPWFDRDLSLAGRVTIVDEYGDISHRLVDWQRPVAVIPSLAIHLDREANEKRTINRQTDLPPVLMTLPDSEAEPVGFESLLLARVNAEAGEGAARAEQLLDYELSLYDTQAPSMLGLEEEFVAAARLDNLLSCYTGLMALLDHDGAGNALLVCSDHEEVGSASAAGAQGNFLNSVISRLCGDQEGFARTMAASLMISADNAHALHPNYADRHEPNHGPRINGGPVIKINANQRYASNSETAGLFRHWCAAVGAPVQSFVVRSDMACGSTIGPIAASDLGVRTVDVGVPTWAMHSIRELAGSRDAFELYRVLGHAFAWRE